MGFSSINWLAMIASVIASMVSGSLWFSPKTFYPGWWKAIGRSESDAPSGQNIGMIWGLTHSPRSGSIYSSHGQYDGQSLRRCDFDIWCYCGFPAVVGLCRPFKPDEQIICWLTNSLVV